MMKLDDGMSTTYEFEVVVVTVSVSQIVKVVVVSACMYESSS